MKKLLVVVECEESTYYELMMNGVRKVDLYADDGTTTPYEWEGGFDYSAMPRKVKFKDTDTSIQQAVISGWNECIDYITGEKNESNSNVK